MRASFPAGVRRRWARWKKSALVLCYHRVISLPSDPQLLAVSPEHFAQHLEVLRTTAAPVSLNAVLTRDRPGARATVALSFDDGYVDNLAVAKPLLEQHDVPATVFVCTGNLGTEQEFWWDDLERALLGDHSLPATFGLEVAGDVVRHDLRGEDGVADGWNVLEPVDPSPRYVLYRDLASRLRPLPPDQRDAAIAAVRAWAGIGAAGRDSHRSLREDEVTDLATGGLIEIGAHTVRHPVLARLSSADQQQELRSSREYLRELTASSVESFAYPFGGVDDFSATTIGLLKDEGFTHAYTTIPGGVSPKGDRYRVPRLLVRDWDGEEFARRLANWSR